MPRATIAIDGQSAVTRTPPRRSWSGSIISQDHRHATSGECHEVQGLTFRYPTSRNAASSVSAADRCMSGVT
jgi:hypothetical protein